jgi:Zn-dependent peptidase ImmA (M78 family)
VRILLLLREVLHRKQTLVLRASDFEGILGATHFDKDAPRVFLNSAQDARGWRSTLAHELFHALRGPVPKFMERMEEVVVRRQTAQLLVPDGPAMATMDKTWTRDEIQDMAARHAIDFMTAQDALNPPTIPIPAVIPLPRDPDNRWS